MDGDQVEENLDQVLDKVKKVDDTCDYKGCKQVSIFGGDLIYGSGC